MVFYNDVAPAALVKSDGGQRGNWQKYLGVDFSATVSFCLSESWALWRDKSATLSHLTGEGSLRGGTPRITTETVVPPDNNILRRSGKIAGQTKRGSRITGETLKK